MKGEDDVLELLRLAKSQKMKGDPEAVRKTYREAAGLLALLYWKYILYLSFRSVPLSLNHLAADIAHEIAQEVFIGAYQSLPGYVEELGTLKSWLGGIFINCRIEGLKRYLKISQINFLASELYEEKQIELVSMEDCLEQKSLIDERMSRLPDLNRIIMVMFLNGMTTKDIATYSDLSEANVRVIKHRTLRFLTNGKDYEVE